MYHVHQYIKLRHSEVKRSRKRFNIKPWLLELQFNFGTILFKDVTTYQRTI